MLKNKKLWFLLIRCLIISIITNIYINEFYFINIGDLYM
jgi:hypothetical protein